MLVNPSIKNTTDLIVQKLRKLAARQHRSPQGELLSTVDVAVVNARPLTPLEVLAGVRKLGLKTEDNAAVLVRADRDRN